MEYNVDNNGSQFIKSNKDEVKNINYDAFLAAVLFTRKRISIEEFNKKINELSDKCNIYVYSTINNFGVDVNVSDKYIELVQDYDEVIYYDNKYVTVRDYLYSQINSSIISSSESYIEASYLFNKVKEFFGLPLQMRPKFILKNYIPGAAKKGKK